MTPGDLELQQRTRLANERVARKPSARALLAYPWDESPLGPVSAWPEALQLLVRVMLTSEFPMMIAWGPEYTQLYNDAFRPILGSEKHPAALGNSARNTWAEIWDDIGPLFSTVFDEGEAVWNADQRLLIDRNGYLEETFFTYSYSPVYDSADHVEGLLVIATESTAEVVDRRRLQCVSALATAFVGATAIEAIAKAAVRALADCADVAAVELDLVVADSVVRIANLGHSVTDNADRDFIRRVASSPEPMVLDDDWEPGRPARRVAFGIDHSDVRIVVVVGLNPNRPYDEEYQQFIGLIRQTIAASMTAALLRAAELGALKEISDTLQHAMLEVASDLPTVAARYLPKTSNLTVGGDWYEVLDLGAGRRALIVGDCVGHGLEPATAMGALRNVSRALLGEGRGPAEVIASLHRFATTMPAAFCATVVCAVIDLPAQTIVYSNAGHPPPLLVRGEEAVWLSDALTAPLAVESPRRTEASVRVLPGDLLVLYTDGLVERRDESIDCGLLRLAECTIRNREAPVQHIADRLLAELVDESPLDDIALVVKRVPQGA